MKDDGDNDETRNIKLFVVLHQRDFRVAELAPELQRRWTFGMHSNAWRTIRPGCRIQGAYFRSKGENMQEHLENASTGTIGRRAAEGHPTHEEIELRAYKAYLARGGAPGQDVADWLQAERGLLDEYGKIGRLAKAATA